ncbi:MAG: exosortase system-associated protein, TIGR04073 family [Candidatus Omnitrophica bacterium]|nr:exosortase system-associated protein, TIGR04073 family [Candidatus Omnitrophota bacterium]
MKKSLLLGLFFLLSSFPLHAAEIEPAGTPLRKLQRGFLNIALSPIEIAHEMHNVKSDESFVPSWGPGLVKGVAYMGGRALAGVYDIFTFPIPAPGNYEPLVYPEFSWEHLDKAKA